MDFYTAKITEKPFAEDINEDDSLLLVQGSTSENKKLKQIKFGKIKASIGSGVSTEQANSLWAIIQKSAFAEILTDAELNAFKIAWGIGENGGDDGGTEPDDPTEPDNPIYVPVEIRTQAISTACTLYSDNGETSFGDDGNWYVQESTETFEQDTDVLITFNMTGTIGTRKSYASCTKEVVQIPQSTAASMVGHYTEELGTLATTSQVRYTVKAGYKLAVIQRGGNIQGTFAVEKAV